MRPVAENAEPLELLALHVDKMARGRLALFADADRVGLGRAQLLHHLELDRQPVAVPARQERREAAAHVPVFQHDVLEHHVERVAHVRVAVGEGRPVVQDEFFGVPARGQDLVVDFFVTPLREHRWLALWQLGAHRKIGLGQEKGGFVVHGSRQTENLDGLPVVVEGPADGSKASPKKYGHAHTRHPERRRIAP